MHTVYVDARLREEARRQRLYAGQIFAFTPQRSTLALRDFAWDLIQEAFAPHDPLEAQYHIPVEEWVERFAPVKPAFIHHSRTKQLIRDVLFDAGCDPGQTYLDVPRLRGVTSGGYLTSGVGYAHHPHRDTWYSAPLAQLNWWLSVTPYDTESALAFHPGYWSEGVENGSCEFSYYEWNASGRRDASKHIRSDTRKQPRAREHVELEPELRVVSDVGGIVLFSAAQMHSTVPNTSGLTRFSIDFRTVNVFDLQNRRGAPNVDSSPRGTSLRDFMRCSDLSPLPDNVVAMYDDGDAVAEEAGDRVLVFDPNTVGAANG
jgi:hypothetical protein